MPEFKLQYCQKKENPKKLILEPGMVRYSYNLSTGEAEAERWKV
jgi:hypothetical protein